MEGRGLNNHQANDAPPLQFIDSARLTHRPRHHHQNNVAAADTLRIIRSHAMRDYVWKQNHPSEAGDTATAANRVPSKQSQYMGRFRLGSKKRTQHGTGTNTKRSKNTSNAEINRSSIIAPSAMDLSWLLHSSLGIRYNPFDANLLSLEPESEKLILYCKLI